MEEEITHQMKECYLYQKFPDKSVQCGACNHRCRVNVGRRGICGIRENRLGKLYLLTYARACAENIDPIEKKPLFYFLPGSQTLTVATVGCNFRCLWCQNYDISQSLKTQSEIVTPIVEGFYLPPEKIVEDALKNHCPSISYSYTEPTVYMDYALDIMKLAKRQKIKNVWVTNGYMTKECLVLIAPYLDAANVDIKTLDKKKFQKYIGAADPKHILESCQFLARKKIHLEITTLVIPYINHQKNDLEQIADAIFNKLGADTPWHLSRFFPAYKYNEEATALKQLEAAYKVGRDSGLKHIYIGNIGHF